MPYISQKLNSHSETLSAIFIIAFVSLFILSNFAAGFILPLFILTIAISSVIAFLYPRSGVAAIIFLTFIFERFFTLQPIVMGRMEYKIYPLDFILGAVILVTLVHMLEGGILNKLKKVDVYLVAFIVLTFFYFIFSVFAFGHDLNLSFSSFKNYAVYALLYFAILFLFENKKDIVWLLKFALAGAITILFFVFYGLITGAGLWSEFTPLSTEGVRTLAFTHAFYLSMALLSLLAYMIFEGGSSMFHRGQKSSSLDKIFTVLIALWAIGIIGSMMRHLWISLAISIFALIIIFDNFRRKELLKIMGKYLLAVMIILVFLFYFSLQLPGSSLNKSTDSVSNIIDQRIGSLSDVSADESFAWRSVVWKEAAAEYIKSPIFGIGLGQKLYTEIGSYRDLVEVRNIHNSPLVLFVQMGVVVFVIFCVFVIKNLAQIYRKKDKDWIDFALIAVMVNYLVAFWFQPYLETNLLGIFFWIILGLIRVNSYENPGNK
jgi:O-antigen ligase